VKRLVIDASVACRFLLPEELSDRANLVLQGFLDGELELIAPGLVNYEVGNALWKAVRQGVLEFSDAKLAYSDFLRLGLVPVELRREQHIDALKWGVEVDSTYYDSVYVSLSKSTGATLLTADDALFEKVGGEILAIHLRDF
jgi:predicted nucleic acid-binding protein